ncbi:MAG: exodeoxyribonuclease VII small subunit [Candidatus Eisenbacteria bacterium]|nr:exodeoxyribonuclease VII small subunit [Candidatus Eisenbacteria bacterium]
MSKHERSRRRASSAAESGGSVAGPAAPDLEAALRRLEQIAERLEGGSLDLEAAMRLYREARELHRVCVRRLSEAEREVRLLTEDASDAQDRALDETAGHEAEE